MILALLSQALTIIANQPWLADISLIPKENKFQKQLQGGQKLASWTKLKSTLCSKTLPRVSSAKWALVWIMSRDKEMRRLHFEGFSPLRKWFYYFRAASAIILTVVLFLLQISHSSLNGACTLCRELINLMTRKSACWLSWLWTDFQSLEAEESQEECS